MPETSRRSRWIVAPLLLVLVLAAAWTGFWFYAARAADRMIAAWIEREAKVGRVYTCASRTIGGYPFRIEARCTDPIVELRGGTAPIVIKARQILAVAQVYQPDLVIAEVTGPMTVTEPGERRRWPATGLCCRRACGACRRRSSASHWWCRARSWNGRARRMPEPVMRAERIEFHVRRSSNPRQRQARLRSRGARRGGLVPAWPALAARPLNAEATAVLSGVSDLSPMPVAARLREWQSAGGRLAITAIRLQQGDAVAVAKGDLGLSPRGRLDGALTITAAGFDELARMLGLPTPRKGGVKPVYWQVSPFSAARPSWRANGRSRCRCASATAPYSSGRFRWGRSGPVLRPSGRHRTADAYMHALGDIHRRLMTAASAPRLVPPSAELRPGRGRVFDSITDTIGDTPLVRLNRLPQIKGIKATMLAKLEFFNPLGSVKDRIGVAMIDALEADGTLTRTPC